jgi:hypothetical protein
MKPIHAHTKPILMALSIAALLSFGSAASAQQSGLVNVDLRNARILNNIANDLNVSVNNVPITVQVPVNVAANVCGVQAAVLSAAAQSNRGASCYAQQTSNALNTAVQRVINLQD